jgi:hypothetical protein
VRDRARLRLWALPRRRTRRIVGRLAGDDQLAGLTAAYYALTYLGFAAPYLLALAENVASYPVLLTGTAALALSTATVAARRSARDSEGPSAVRVTLPSAPL